MPRHLLGLTAAILLIAAIGVSTRLVPAAPVTLVHTIPTVTAPAQPTTSTTIDWKPGVRYTLAILAARAEHARVVKAIRYASALAEQEQLRSRLVANHAAVVPRPPAWKPTWTSDRFCQFAPFIRQVWTRDADWAIGIAMRESRCQPGAYNPSSASGLFQIEANSWHGPCRWSARFDAMCNIRAAWSLYLQRGRAPWAL